jgi:proteasome accessory factor C
MNDTGTLINLLTLLVNKPGITVSEAADVFACSEKDLIKSLDRLMMVGVPPYMPHDFISFGAVHSGSCKILINFGDHFGKPLNFLAPEVMALRFAIDLARPKSDAATLETLERIDNVLAEALRGRAESLARRKSRAFVVPRQADRMRGLLETLTKAAEKRLLLEIEYFSSHRRSLDTRRVHPFELLESGAHTYLWAWCETAGDTRHFRVDRIRTARQLQEASNRKRPARRNPGRMRTIFDGKPRDTLVLRFSKELADEIAEEWDGADGCKVARLKDGRVELRAPLYNEFWAVGYVMSFGPHAQLVEPRSLRVALKTTIRKTLAAHEGA